MMRARGTNACSFAAISQMRVHAVVHEIDLPAAVEFLLDRGLDELVIPTGDHRLNRNAVFGWGFNHAHVAQADHGHVQGARNRRG